MGIQTTPNFRLDCICVFSAIIVCCLTEVELDLKLTNTSPAVLDSNITFRAVLNISPHRDGQNTMYKYVWTDSASSKNRTITYGNGTSQLNRLYAVESMQDYKPGMYTMKVEVYEKANSSLEGWLHNQKAVARGTITFNLTDSLNVSVLLNQSLATVSPEGVFATNKMLQVSPDVNEAFDTVDYKYELYTNGSLTYRGKAPDFHITYNQTGRTNVSLHVIANITIAEAGWPVDRHIRTGWRNLTIQLKDSVNDIKYLGQSQYLIGKEISATFVCKGSPPFLFWFEMSGNISPSKGILPVTVNSKSHAENHGHIISPVTVSQTDKTAVCLAKFTHMFNETGNFTVSLRVQNDVGLQQTQVSLKVVYPDEDTPPVVIAMCVVIAIFCFSLITIVYLKEQDSIVRTPNEETANHYFYFSPGEGTSEGPPSSPTLRKVTRPRQIRAGLSIMYSTAKSWVVSVASSHGSQTSGLSSYDEL